MKKVFGFLPKRAQEFLEMIFKSAAENHIKIIKSGQQKYRSYTQLKRHQKKVRTTLSLLVLIFFSLTIGMSVGPIFFPQPAETEIYIPNGKGDILVSNVSRSQATVIFRTLDGANGNIPLATKATVEFYEDPELTDLARRITEQEYAVTHIVSADSLQENKIYYIKIIAKDAAKNQHEKVVTSWGSGNDKLKVFTTGELIPVCATEKPVKNIPEDIESKVETTNANNQEINNVANSFIENVQNENYLQPGNKIQTIISWTTPVPSSTSLTLKDSKSNVGQKIIISEDLVTKHAAILTSLKAGSTYYFTAESKDANGNILSSEEYSIRTPKAQENIVQKISKNFKGIFFQIKPR